MFSAIFCYTQGLIKKFEVIQGCTSNNLGLKEAFPNLGNFFIKLVLNTNFSWCKEAQIMDGISWGGGGGA